MKYVFSHKNVWSKIKKLFFKTFSWIWTHLAQIWTARKYIKIFNKYVLPQSLETQSLSVAKWKPQITDLSLEIGWERDSWIPHIMPPGLYYVICTCFEACTCKHIMLSLYYVTFTCFETKMMKAYNMIHYYVIYICYSKIDKSILVWNSMTLIFSLFRHIDESI